jgi:polysaccharide export outer membrane protein
VAGKVGASGLVPLDRSTRILDVLLRSGWVRDDGAEYVLLRRAADGKEVRINSDELARGLADNIPLSPGDTIFVPDAELVYITGQINRAGGYPLKPGMNITQLLAQAGGVGPSGSQGRFGLKRGGSPREIDADQTTLLQPGDIVNVRERLF